MLTVRLQRTGRRNLPSYRLVVADRDAPVKGRFVEIVGHYLPARTQPVFEINEERIVYWTSKGAIPSDTVARLLKKKGMDDMDKFIKRYAKRRSKSAPPEEEAAAAPPASAEAPAEQSAPEPVADTPAADAPAEQPAAETASESGGDTAA